MPPPKHLATVGDHTQLVKPSTDTPEQVKPVDQVVIRKANGGDEHFPLFPGMRPEQLRSRVSAAGFDTFKTAWLHCDDARWEEYSTLVRDAWPNKAMRHLSTLEAGTHTVRGKSTFTFGDHYFRAIAKIAFHYFLAHSKRGTRGDEPEFEAIRRFIIDGGDVANFFPSNLRRFAVPFGKLRDGRAVVPARWCHILAADESSDAIVGYVHLFAGPKTTRNPHHVLLGPVPGNIIVPGGVSGHLYQYENRAPDGKYAGSVIPVTPTRIV